MYSRPLLSLALSLQTQMEQFRKCGEIYLIGNGLSIAAVAAVARHDCRPVVEDEALIKMSHDKDSLGFQEGLSNGLSSGLSNGLSNGLTIYGEFTTNFSLLAVADRASGVHTGFGGSADTRPRESSPLARGLMQLLQVGVLTDDDLSVLGTSPNCMPSSWTRATMAVRINQCVRGHSAISPNTINSLLELMAARVTPIVPLRGSISASGDLMPLSYVAGTLEGSPDIFVTQGSGTSARIMSARDALEQLGMEPLRLGPREGLGLVNGTAASAATASLAILDAMHLTLISTALTCLVSEGMAARAEWLHPFIHETRPHPGQQEVAGIMRAFLKGSLLVSGIKQEVKPQRRPLFVRPDKGLSQDRYPLRTSPQWLGPQFEDFLLAHSQINIELNSNSDNPLTDPASGAIYHGGNFQAVSITSAVEKVRSGLQMVGKLLFSQCTEMINHHMSAGLPPNLAADDPSASFCCKGLDIGMAAYQSELSYLSNSMSNHVQSAEMHNQAVNSLALLSTRYTIKSVEIVGLMVAGVLYAACQAMDLRVMHTTFLEAATTTLFRSYAPLLAKGFRLESVELSLAAAFRAFQNVWWDKSASDAPERCSFGAKAFVQALCEQSKSDPSARRDCDCLVLSVEEMRQLQSDMQNNMFQAYQTHRLAFMRKPTTKEFVGKGSKSLYLWVREELNIPMHCGLVDHPMPGSSGVQDSDNKRTIGSHVSKIYEAVQDGTLFERFAVISKELGLDDTVPSGVSKASKELRLGDKVPSFVTTAS